MGGVVAANSQLANEFHHQLVLKSMNLNRIVVVPRDFDDLRGYDNQTTKTNLTDEYSIEFGIGESSSYLD